jgi:hypothetical protein
MKAVVDALSLLTKEAIIAKKIPQLQNEKKEALSKEDYDRVKEINEEAEKLFDQVPTAEDYEKAQKELDKFKKSL